jgi:hypothetical protein
MSVPRMTEHYRDPVAKTSVKTRHDNFRIELCLRNAGRLLFAG